MRTNYCAPTREPPLSRRIVDPRKPIELSRASRHDAARTGLCYVGTCIPMSHTTGGARAPSVVVERVQTGVRLEKRLLKVLKALADYHDLSLGDLLEGIVLHAFEGKAPFGKESLERIEELKRVFGLTLDARHSHRLKEQPTRKRR